MPFEPRHTDALSAIQNYIQKGALQVNVPYSRQELIAAGMSDTDLNNFQSAIRAVAEGTASYDDITVTIDGGKRNRRYILRLANQPIQLSTAMPESNIMSSDVGASEEASPRRNDAPEDRYHIAAHIALIEHLKCLAISQPKTTKKTKDDNPDIVGILAHEYQTSRDFDLSWTGRAPPNPFLFVGCEVKCELHTFSQLYDAVRETRHNCRYFDASYLIAAINTNQSDLVNQARELAGEYELGIINLSPSTNFSSDILHLAPTRINSRLYNFFSDRSHARATSDKLSELGRLCLQIQDQDLRFYALTVLLTEQDVHSIVPRLPEGILKGLRSPPGNGTAEKDVFCQIVARLLLDYYEAAEDITSLDELVSRFWHGLQNNGHRHFNAESIRKALGIALGSHQQDATEKANQISSLNARFS